LKTLYLVRHGQADRLGKDYDQLTDKGYLQAKKLGEYFLKQNIEFDFVSSGNLRRQIQTVDAVRNEFTKERFCIPESITDDKWNEFDSRLWLGIASRIREVDSDFANLYSNYKESWERKDPQTLDLFQILIHRVLSDWVGGNWNEVAPYSFLQYKDRISSALKNLPEKNKSILVVTSSTPIAIATGISLGLQKEQFLPLMKFIQNTSLTIFRQITNRWELDSFNGRPHLNSEEASIG